MTKANELGITGNPDISMSSLEISELTGKLHKNVLRDIENVLKELEIDRLKFERVYNAGNGERRKCYNLPKDLTLTLVSGYNVKLRKKIIDRWLELEEGKSAFSLPRTLPEALRLAADQAEQIEGMKPKVAAFERLAFGRDALFGSDISLPRFESSFDKTADGFGFGFDPILETVI